MTTINKLNAVPEAPVTVHLIDAGDDDPANPDARIHCTQYAAAIINGVRAELQDKADALNVQIARWNRERAQANSYLADDGLRRSILKARDELAAMNTELATTPTPQ